jgi:hypothetical protein
MTQPTLIEHQQRLQKLIDTVAACDRMARTVGLRFVPDKKKLEWLGLTSEEIDDVMRLSRVDL